MAVLNHRCWVAVTGARPHALSFGVDASFLVNPGATSHLLAAINTTDAGYDTSQAISAYLTNARNEAA